MKPFKHFFFKLPPGSQLAKMPQKRKRRPGKSCTDVAERLLKMKVQCNFSAAQLKSIISLYKPADAELIEKVVNKELRQNYSVFRLHGCSRCEDFIWIAGENMDCYNCNNQDGRFLLCIFFTCLLFLLDTHCAHTDIIPSAIQPRKCSTSHC